jgi:hypothetical protein
MEVLRIPLAPGCPKIHHHEFCTSACHLLRAQRKRTHLIMVMLPFGGAYGAEILKLVPVTESSNFGKPQLP